MEVKAWNNGKHFESGAGYGIKLKVEDIDQNFDRSWEFVIIKIVGRKEFTANLSQNFWAGPCYEIHHNEIGKWLIQLKIAPWTKGSPPRLILNNIEGNKFKLQGTR